MRKVSVTELVDVARSSRPEDRGILVDSINDLCLRSGRRLNDHEKELVYDILATLIQDVELNIRRELSEQLADRDDAPRDLVKTLASDVIDVAQPVIVRSVVLDDRDLIELVLDHAETHQLAVTRRQTLSPEVTESIADTGNPAVINAMLENQGAEISRRTMQRLVDSSAEETSLQEPLIKRADLSEDLARRMYGWVGDALRDYIEEKYAPPEDIELDSAVTQAVSSALGTDIFDSEDEAPPPKPHFGYRPHPRLLVRALEENDVFRFEELFREMTDMSSQAATRVLYDSGPEAIAIACKACNVDKTSFGKIIAHLQGGGDPDTYMQTPAFVKIVDYFNRIDASGAMRVLHVWRDAPGDSWHD